MWSPIQVVPPALIPDLAQAKEQGQDQAPAPRSVALLLSDLAHALLDLIARLSGLLLDLVDDLVGIVLRLVDVLIGQFLELLDELWLEVVQAFL